MKREWRLFWSILLTLSLCACASRPPTVAEGLSFYDDGDVVRALSVLTSLADNGDSHAQQVLGVMYENGQGVNKNPQQAFKWYMLSAEAGNASAQYHLARLYEAGSGVSRSAEQALKWFALAGANGHPSAQYQLGLIDLNGTGHPSEPQSAAKWFALAAAQGDPQAQYQLGDMLSKGLGTARNVTLGYMWLDIARGLGEPSAILAATSLAKQISAQERVQAEAMSLQCIKQSYQNCAKLVPSLPESPH